MIKFAHTNIITDDWKKLAKFYINVFNCKPLFPERDLKGNWLDKATNIENAHLVGIHLALPGYEKKLPTLEIFQYDNNLDNLEGCLNRKGFGHIAFHVNDVSQIVKKAISYGGNLIGEIVNAKIEEKGILTFAYLTDPEDNIIEIQNWSVSQ